MKSIKQIREQYDLITEREDKEEKKLTALVRAGLVDTNKLPIIKRALNKDNKVLTPTERNTLLSLLDSLMAQVLSSQPVYTKVRQNVMSMNEEKEPLRSVRMNDMPSIIVLKRRAIRVYPGGQNVGLYYSQQLDRYVAVPFGSNKNDVKSVLSMSEEVEQIEEISDQTAHNAFAKLHYKAREAHADKNEKDTEKYVKKTAKVGLMQVAKVARRKGWQHGAGEAKKLLKYSKKYRDVADLMEARVRTTITGKYRDDEERQSRATEVLALHKKMRQKKDKPVVKPNAQPVKKPEPEKSSDNVVQKRKARRDQWKAYEKDREERGSGSFAGDVVKHGSSHGILPAIGIAIAGARYRKRNPKPVADPSIDEGLKEIGSAVWQGAKNVAGGVMKGLSSGEGGGSHPVDSDEKSGRLRKYRSNRTSRMRVKTSGIQADRERRFSSSTTPKAIPSGGQHQVQETSELNLDGNRFYLNTGIANKVLNVYQSLNEENRQKMVDKMAESKESFNKVISFAIRH